MDSQGPKTTIPTLQPPPPPPPRRILGDVSPNLRNTMAGSADSAATDSFSLKRSVSATLDNESGFTYLKKRKLSSDGTLSGARKPSLGTTPAQKTTTTTIHATLNAPSREQTSCHSLKPAGLYAPTRPGDDDEGSETSAERKSFSSLINYDPSSQTVAGSQDQQKLLFSGPSYAEQLKLRLRLATYKIRTNQVHVAFKDLLESDPNQNIPNCSEAEEAVAALRAEAQLRMAPDNRYYPARPRPRLALFPAPMLRPTDYSSRLVYERERGMRSSPPADASPRPAPAGLATPAAGPRGDVAEEELTSSMIKGRVAAGLLDLRHAV